MARYAAEGHDVLVVTLTGGERGDILNPAMDLPGITDESPRSAATRWPRRPQHSASSNPGWASSTPDCPRAIRCRRCRRDPSRWCRWRSPTEALVRVIRDFRPHVMITYDENGGYPASRPHPLPRGVDGRLRGGRGSRRLPRRRRSVDRVASCTTTTDSSATGCMLLLRRVRPATAGRVRSRSGSRTGIARWRHDGPGHHPGRVCGVLRAARRRAAGARHADRPERRSSSPYRLEWQQRLWPTEEFELARSRVTTSIPETDLFAGIED